MVKNNVDEFLDNNNLKYIFVILASMESKRLTSLPKVIKNSIPSKITEVALDHVADGNFPIYDLSTIDQ